MHSNNPRRKRIFGEQKTKQKINNTLYVEADLENVLVGIFMTLFWLFK